MDKYEFNIKVEQIKKMVSRGDYGTAMKIADTIDWHRVRNASLLSMIAQIYEKNEEYQEAKDILLLAFERAPVGKRLLYKLADLALKDGSTAEAEAYYREFCDLAQDDPRQYLLRYKILKAKKAPVDQLIRALEVYTASEVDEKWLYELADLYHKAGIEDKCVATCDRIMLLFGLGKYVDKAMDLKLQYAPLNKYQMDLVENRDKYEAKLRAVEEEYSGNAPELDDYDDLDDIKDMPDEILRATIYELEDIPMRTLADMNREELEAEYLEAKVGGYDE
jgi:tetratricopeptide (TPR) repeat protein